MNKHFMYFSATIIMVAKHRDHVQQIFRATKSLHRHTEQSNSDESCPTTVIAGSSETSVCLILICAY